MPALVDAGIRSVSDAAIAMELGNDGTLMNTVIAKARGPVRRARACSPTEGLSQKTGS